VRRPEGRRVFDKGRDFPPRPGRSFVQGRPKSGPLLPGTAGPDTALGRVQSDCAREGFPGPSACCARPVRACKEKPRAPAQSARPAGLQPNAAAPALHAVPGRTGAESVIWNDARGDGRSTAGPFVRPGTSSTGQGGLSARF